MPSYYDKKTKKWYCKFYYTDYNGTRRQKKKCGFTLQRDSKEWERRFLEMHSRDVNICFSSFTAIYLHDMESHLKESTMQTKKQIINNQLVPYFKQMYLSQITPVDIRNWQNSMLRLQNENGYSKSYIQAMHHQLSAIFNYAVKYYGLPQNPCRISGSIGSVSRKEMLFWTKQEFDSFLPALLNRPSSYLAFLLLYYTGMRTGELLALTSSDIHLSEKYISITKSFQRLHKQDVITPPKTPKSRRNISLPIFLCNNLKDYIEHLPDSDENLRLFPFTKHFLHKELRRGCQASGVKLIRIHDLRHSHASLLIELGFSPLLIAERLGHEKVETTLNTYGHLYPNKQEIVAQKLQDIF